MSLVILLSKVIPLSKKRTLLLFPIAKKCEIRTWSFDSGFGDVDGDILLERSSGELGGAEVQEDGLVHVDGVAGRVHQKFFD